MDSQLAAVLTSSKAALMNRAHLPEGTGKSVEMLPLTDIQDVPIDLSLKASCSLPPDSQPVSLKLTPSCNNKAKQFYWAETMIQGRTSEMSQDNTDTLEIVAEVTGVHKPILSNTDSSPTSCMESLTSGFTGCLLEQKAATCKPCSNEQSDHPTVSQATVKEEIEEVCIGEMEGYSEDFSDSPISLNEIHTEDKNTAGGITDGTDTQSTVVSGANSDKVPADTITALKMEHEDIAVDSCGFRIRDSSISERQLPDMNGNISSSMGVGTQVETQAQINSGISSDSSELPINGSPAEGEGKEMKARKGRKESTNLPVVPTYSICTRSQRRREINREAKEECGKGKNTNLRKERKRGEELPQSSPPVSDLPRVSEGLCKTEREQEEGAETDEIKKGRGLKRKMEEEVLDLSFSRKGGRSDIDRRRGAFEAGAGSEAMLVMEVDEIVQHEVEEEEDKEAEQEDAQVLSREKEMAVNLEAPLSSSPPPSSPLVSPLSFPVDLSLDSLLLIDDQGIPYMLTPDGQKVLQVELPKPYKVFTARPRPKSKQVKAEDYTVICSPDVALSKPGSLSTLPCQASGASLSCLTSPASPESSVISKMVLPSGTSSSAEAAPQPPTVLDLASKPIRILANPTTTSPILLFPSSNLPSLSSSKPNTNSGFMALSLPPPLTQKSPSAPLFLVISPLATGSAPSFSSSALAVSNPVPSSLPVKQISSPSTVSLPISSVQTNLDSFLPSSSSLPALNPDSSMLSTSILGISNQSTPTLPSVSSTSTKQPNPDVSLTKCSPLQSIPEPDPPADTKSTSIADTQIQCAQSLIPAPLSPTETPPNPPTHSLNAAPSPASKPSPTPHTSADQFSPDDSPYPTSDTPPPATIFPTNHPKNLSLSPNCPRRILYCQFCPRAFYYLSDLERHSITHSQSKPHVCPLCSKAFKRSSHLERHKHIHTGQRNFICPICSKRFREAGELLRHQRVHTGEKPFQCPQCHMRFAERNTLRRHAKRKHQDPQGLDGQEEGCHVSDGGQEDAEWYSCTVPELDSDNETDRE